MTVSTIFLQTTNEGDNEYSDTTFSIHVPAQDKSYKLSVASFMFRPHIILMDTTDYMTLELEVRRLHPPDYDAIGTTFWLQSYPTVVTIKIPVSHTIKFNPSQKEVTHLSDIFTEKMRIEIPVKTKRAQLSTTYSWTVSYTVTKGFTYEETADNRLKLSLTTRYVDVFNLDEVAASMIPNYYYDERDAPGNLVFQFVHCKLVDISPRLSYFTGLKPATFNETKHSITVPNWNNKLYSFYDFDTTAPHCYNPQYWNYITLSCNKTYNSGNIVNQERFNTDIDESSQFYKGQILAYMPNNAYAPEAMQTGMATANEYIIQPADFNSIRFWLNYDNGEPVRLCSPMTIVLNMMPNQ